MNILEELAEASHRAKLASKGIPTASPSSFPDFETARHRINRSLSNKPADPAQTGFYQPSPAPSEILTASADAVSPLGAGITIGLKGAKNLAKAFPSAPFYSSMPERFETAKQLYLDGDMSPSEITKHLGIFRQADNNLRAEIPDIRPDYLDQTTHYPANKDVPQMPEFDTSLINTKTELSKLSPNNIMQHAYPETADMPINAYYRPDDMMNGSYSPHSLMNAKPSKPDTMHPVGSIDIYDSSQKFAPSRTLQHELQHVADNLEMYPSGSSWDNFHSGNDDDNFANYLNTLGEINARRTAERLNWTQDERALEPFNDHTPEFYGYPVFDRPLTDY